MSIKFEKLNNVTDKENLVESFDEILVKLEHLVESLKVNNPKNNSRVHSEWLSLKDAAIYAGVSYNTFITFRHMGLKVCEIEGIKRVSRKEIDSFLESHSY